MLDIIDNFLQLLTSFKSSLAIVRQISCGWRFEHVNHITMYVVTRDISSRLSANSEVSPSELLENLEEMFPHY